MQEEKETTCGLCLILKQNSRSDAMSATTREIPKNAPSFLTIHSPEAAEEIESSGSELRELRALRDLPSCVGHETHLG
jgi:hypothetical protein